MACLFNLGGALFCIACRSKSRQFRSHCGPWSIAEAREILCRGGTWDVHCCPAHLARAHRKLPITGGRVGSTSSTALFLGLAFSPSPSTPPPPLRPPPPPPPPLHTFFPFPAASLLLQRPVSLEQSAHLVENKPSTRAGFPPSPRPPPPPPPPPAFPDVFLSDLDSGNLRRFQFAELVLRF